MHKVAQYCSTRGIRPGVIFASPLIRAQQTAKAVAKELHVALNTARWLACGAMPDSILAELTAFGEARSVMLVGHEPDLGHLIAHLLGAASGSIRVRKASLTHIELLLPRKGGGRLEFSIPVRMM